MCATTLRRAGVDRLEQLRVDRTVARASLTECALVSGIPLWRVQGIFAGTIRAKPVEIRALQAAIKKLARAVQHKRNLLRQANHDSAEV